MDITKHLREKIILFACTASLILYLAFSDGIKNYLAGVAEKFERALSLFGLN